MFYFQGVFNDVSFSVANGYFSQFSGHNSYNNVHTTVKYYD